MNLLSELQQIASHSQPLLVSDFDGTLADLCDIPNAVQPVSGAVESLEAIAANGTNVYVLSGRALEDLQLRIGPIRGVTLLGSYGHESSSKSVCLTSEEAARRSSIRHRIVKTLEYFRPAWMECKPLGAAVHMRLLEKTTQGDCRAALIAALAEYPDLHIHHDLVTMEVAIRPYSKWAAILSIRRHHPECPCVFAGDDASDEESLSSLRAPDCSIVVGARTSRAMHRIASPADFVGVLARFAALRPHDATTHTIQSSLNS